MRSIFPSKNKQDEDVKLEKEALDMKEQKQKTKDLEGSVKDK